MEFKEMSLEELEALRTAISEEIARRKLGGEFLKVTDEHMVPEGSVIVEVCGDDIVAYRMTSDGAEAISKAKTNAMSSLIQEVAKAL